MHLGKDIKAVGKDQLTVKLENCLEERCETCVDRVKFKTISQELQEK